MLFPVSVLTNLRAADRGCWLQLITFLLLVHGVLFPVMCVAYIKNFWIGKD